MTSRANIRAIRRPAAAASSPRLRAAVRRSSNRQANGFVHFLHLQLVRLALVDTHESVRNGEEHSFLDLGNGGRILVDSSRVRLPRDRPGRFGVYNFLIELFDPAEVAARGVSGVIISGRKTGSMSRSEFNTLSELIGI